MLPMNLFVGCTFNDNLLCKIAKKFNERWPENVTLMRYFPFLYQFCYKPFLADIIQAKGITYDDPPHGILNTKREYYISPQGYFYSNRLAYCFEKKDVIEDIKYRITKYDVVNLIVKPCHSIKWFAMAGLLLFVGWNKEPTLIYGLGFVAI